MSTYILQKDYLNWKTTVPAQTEFDIVNGKDIYMSETTNMWFKQEQVENNPEWFKKKDESINDLVDKNFVSPRTLPWLYNLIVENGIEVTIKPCKDEGMVDVTLSKSVTFKGNRKLSYSTTCRDFLDTIHPFINQHNCVSGVVKKIMEWEKEEKESSDRLEEVLRKEHPERIKKKEGWSHSIFPGQFIADNIELVVKIIGLKMKNILLLKDHKYEEAATCLDEEVKLMSSKEPVFMVMLQDLLKKHLSDYTKNTPDPSVKEIVDSLRDKELKIIKASEAKQISELQSSKDSEFNKTMSDIEQQARNGRTSISFFMLYNEIIIDKLRQLGYVVTPEGPFSTWVNWDNPTV